MLRTSFTTQIQQCIAKPGCVANYDAVPGKICLEEYTGLNFQSNMQMSSFDFARNLFSARIYFQPESIISQLVCYSETSNLHLSPVM